MCSSCFKNTIKTKTTFTVDFEERIIIVRNVPCLECQMCGEIIFSEEVSANLERIVENAKSLMQEVSIIDYEKAA